MQGLSTTCAHDQNSDTQVPPDENKDTHVDRCAQSDFQATAKSSRGNGDRPAIVLRDKSNHAKLSSVSPQSSSDSQYTLKDRKTSPKPSPPSSAARSRNPSPQHSLRGLECNGSSSDAFDIQEYVFKVLVIGDSATGKSSIIQRHTTGKWYPQYKTTIGSDFIVKQIKWDEKTNVTLHFWDIAGQERFASLTRMYYRQAQAAIVVFDLTRPKTFQGVDLWKKDLDSKASMPNGASLPVLLFANKSDLLEETFEQKKGNNSHYLLNLQATSSPSFLDAYCEQNNFQKWFRTSAKSGEGIDAGIRYLVETMLKNDYDYCTENTQSLKVNAGKFSLLESQDINLMNGSSTSEKLKKSSSCCS